MPLMAIIQWELLIGVPGTAVLSPLVEIPMAREHGRVVQCYELPLDPMAMAPLLDIRGPA